MSYDNMRTWEHDGREGIEVSSDGAWLEYGAFGRDTYGLHTTVDAEPCTICLRADYDEPAPTKRADWLLDKLATGWRPANW